MSNGCQHPKSVIVEQHKVEITGKLISRKVEDVFTIIKCEECKGILRVLLPDEYKPR
jgi:hypothetical protein